MKEKMCKRKTLFRSRLVYPIILVAAFIVGTGCQKDAIKAKGAITSASNPAKTTAVKTKKIVLAISGMTCSGCVAHITGTLKKTKGVCHSKVTLKPPRAFISYDPKQVALKTLIARIKGSGYTAWTLKQPAAKPKSSNPPAKR